MNPLSLASGSSAQSTSNGDPSNAANQALLLNALMQQQAQGIPGMAGMLGQTGQMNQMQPPMSLQNPFAALPQLGSFNSLSAWPQQQQFTQQASQDNTGSPMGPGAAVNPMLQQYQMMNLANMLSGNVLNNALRLSTPVGSSPNDEELLIQTLKASSSRNQTYRQALESLHDVNNHAAHVWKDYYLDHKHRIDDLVASAAAKDPSLHHVQRTKANSASSSGYAKDLTSPIHAKHTAKKPSFTSALDPSRSHSRSSSSRPHTNGRQDSHISTSGSRPGRPRKPRAAPQPPFLPKPPLRTPTPPTLVVPSPTNRGNLFTEEDQEFFLNFVSREAHKDPTATRSSICAKIARLVPHHTVYSWESWWSRRCGGIADRILAAARGESYDLYINGGTDEDDENPSESDPDYEGYGAATQPQPYDIHYKDSGPYDDGSNDEFSGLDTDDDEAKLADFGKPFTVVEHRIMARFIAYKDQMTGKEWTEFEGKYPQRAAKSWAEGYRRQKNEIDRLARKYRKRQEKRRSSIKSQMGRPSWANKDKSMNGPPRLKRKSISDEGNKGTQREGSSVNGVESSAKHPRLEERFMA